MDASSLNQDPEIQNLILQEQLEKNVKKNKFLKLTIAKCFFI
jgi:hypothetical protein